MIYLKKGNIPLTMAYNDEIVQEANGTYQLSFYFPITDALWKELTPEIYLLADDLHGEQEFFIFEVVKRNGYLRVYANQVVSLLNAYSISKISVDRQTGTRVMAELASSIIRQSPFTFYSDISSRHTFNTSNESAMEALTKGKHSILGQWGGDLVRKKYRIELLVNGGSENESLFMYKKNLKSFDHQAGIKNLATRLHLLKRDEETKQVIRATVDSPLIGKYSQIYERNIEVQTEKVETEADLIEYGRKYFSSSLCDLVEENLTIDVEGEPDVPIQLFDVVSVYHEQFDVDLRLKITKYSYAPMRKKLKSIGFGQVKTSLAQTMSGIASEVSDKAVSQAEVDFERRLQKELANSDRVVTEKLADLKQDIDDGFEQAKAEAEVFRASIQDDITSLDEQTKQLLSGIEESDKKATEALDRVGVSGSLAQEAKEIAEMAKTAAVNAGSAALTKVEEVAGDVTKLLTTVNQVKTTANNAAIDLASLSVGGRNYVLDSDTFINSGSKHFELSPDFFKHAKPGKTLVVSFEAEASGLTSAYGRFRIGFELAVDTPRGRLYFGCWLARLEKIERNRYSAVTQPLPDDFEIIRIHSLAFHIQVNGQVEIGKPKIEIGSIPTDWTLAPEDLTMSVDFNKVKETAQLYERVIGKTEGDITTNIARQVMTSKLMQTEVTNPLSGLSTTVTQLSDNYAIKVFGADTDAENRERLLTELNLNPGGVRIAGQLIHLDGSVTMNEAFANKIKALEIDASKITSGTLNANRIAAETITASHLKLDQAFFNKLGANEAYLKQLFAKSAFISQVQAVTLSANKISGGLLVSNNGNTQFNLNNGRLEFNNNNTGVFRVQENASTQGILFRNDNITVNGTNRILSRAIFGAERRTNNLTGDWNKGGFNGIVVDTVRGINTTDRNDADRVNVIGDNIRLVHSYHDDADTLPVTGWNVKAYPNTNPYPYYVAIEPILADKRKSRLNVGEIMLYTSETSGLFLSVILDRILANIRVIADKQGIGRRGLYWNFTDLLKNKKV